MNTTIARCWLIVRRDERVFAFTDHDSNLEIDGVTFLYSPSLKASAQESSIGLSSDSIELFGAFVHESILRSEVEQGLFDQGAVKAFEYDWKKHTKLSNTFEGVIVRNQFDESKVSIEAEASFGKLDLVYGRGFHRTCDANLGDKSCGLRLVHNVHYFFSTPLLVEKFILKIDKIESAPENSFYEGYIEFFFEKLLLGRFLIRQDNLAGNVREFKTWAPMRDRRFIDCSVKITVGCSKSVKFCNEKFDNVLNFRGFPTIPNDDWLKVAEDETDA